MSPYRLSDSELETLLQDDAPCGDATTFALGIDAAAGRMIFRARYAMVVCGSEEAQRLGELRGLRLAGPRVASGTRLAAGEEILRLEGQAGALHLVWKTAQTLMEYLSGIATCAADIVAAAQRGNAQASVVCTRKNFPGTKRAALKAILCAGASPHRVSLSETILLFAEHRAFLAGETPPAIISRLRCLWPERAVVVEVGSTGEARQWLEAGADIAQLEKMSPDAVAALTSELADHGIAGKIAAAGGINAGNAEDYARAGARILVTSAPYFAPPRDVAVTLTPLEPQP